MIDPRGARALGVLAVVGLTAAASVYADAAPWLTPLASAAAWAVGKLLGVPVDSVVDAALQAMRTDRKVQITVRALASLPPKEARQAAESLAPAARTSLVEFVDSIRPPPP